jgi:hypothetical protein
VCACIFWIYFGEIAIFILKLSSKAQIGPSTIKTATLVIEFAISVQSYPHTQVRAGMVFMYF